MKIENPKKISYNPSIFDIKIVRVFVILFLIIAAIIVIPIFLIIDFINRKILKKKKEIISEFQDNFFFENENLKLFKNPIEYNNESDQVGENFLWKMVDYDDELEVFRLETKPKIIGVDDNFFTEFKMITKDFIYLQKIFKENDETTSALISLNKTNYEVKFVKEIGNYALYKFDLKKMKLYGFNKKNKIEYDISEIE